MSDTPPTNNDPDTKRRRLLQAIGIGGVSLAATGPAAAHPHGRHENASGQSEVSSDDTDDDGDGHGYGDWCQSAGFGPGMVEGQGYRRRFPHTDDETEWDGWQPGDGRPPWARGGDDEDEDEDEAEETYDLTVVVADPEGVPVSDVDVEVSGRANTDFDTTTVTTDENGIALLDLSSGKYTVTVVSDSTEYTTPDPTNINVTDDDVALTISLAAPDESEDDTNVDDGDNGDSDSGEDTTETYTLSVHVYDADTEEPLPDRTVTVTEGPETGDEPEDFEETDATTNSEGIATVELGNGSYELVVETDDDYYDMGTHLFTIDGEDRSYPVPLMPLPEGEDSAEEPQPATIIEQRIFEVTNSYREFQSVPTLEFTDDLAAVARDHSETMATEDSFSHTSPNGDGPGDRLEDAGLDCERWAENIAWESGDQIHEPDDAVSIANSVAEGWISSDGHRENILGNYEHVGVGAYIDTDAGEAFVTQVFCTPADSPSDGDDSAEDGSADAAADAASSPE